MKCTDCSRPIKPVVAVDIDGTTGDYHGHFLNFAEGWLGVPGTMWPLNYDGSTDLATFMGITKEVYRKIKLAYRQGGLKRTMPAFQGAAFLTARMRAFGAEVWVTTTRPYMRLDNIDPDTQEWLHRNDIFYDGLIYDEEKYLRLVDIVGKDRVVGVVDDLPLLYDRAEALGLSPIQRGTRYNSATKRPIRENDLYKITSILIDRVKDWKEIHG